MRAIFNNKLWMIKQQYEIVDAFDTTSLRHECELWKETAQCGGKVIFILENQATAIRVQI